MMGRRSLRRRANRKASLGSRKSRSIQDAEARGELVRGERKGPVV